MTYPVTPYTWTLDGKTFGTGDGAYITHAEGWASTPQPRTNRSPRVAAAGDYAGSTYGGPRTIEIKGVWQTATRAERFAALDALAELFTAGDPETNYVISRTEGDRSRRTGARLDDELDPQVRPSGLIVFETQLYCPDQRWWSLTATDWPITPLPADAPGGVLWNGSTGTTGNGVLWNGSLGTTGGGVEWGASSTGGDGTVLVSNAGNAAAGVVVRFHSTGGTGLLNPFVTIPVTGETLQYAGIIPVGQVLVIDTETGIVTLQGTYLPSALSRDDFFTIPRRSSRRLLFGSQGPADQGYMSGYNYSGYQGG